VVYKNGDSFVIAQREFQRESGIHRNCDVPSALAIITWVWNFEATGSALKKKGGCVKTVRTPKNIAAVKGSTQFCVSLLCVTQAVRSQHSTYFMQPPFFFSFEPRSWWHVLMEQHNCDESRTLFEMHAKRSQNCHCFCKTLSQQKHVVLQSMAPLQLKHFKFGIKMAIVSFAPVSPNQKNSVVNSPHSLTYPVSVVYIQLKLNNGRHLSLTYKVMWLLQINKHLQYKNYCIELNN
jgi:hypothetical protein